MRDCVSQPDSARLVRLLPTCPPAHLLVNRRVCSPSFTSAAAPAAAPTWSRTMPTRSPTMAELLLRCSWAVHDVRSPSLGVPIPMRKQPTGEPVAGEPHTGFGGRGRGSPLPTPILTPHECLSSICLSTSSMPLGARPLFPRASVRVYTLRQFPAHGRRNR